MTPTRLSKIARLPAHIREQLNCRLHDGKLSKNILPWVNSLPETKEVLAELFNSKPITHQNLSEWRRAGYQDWLFHQQRLDWFDHLTEQSTEIVQHDGCPDTFETMANIFLYEIAQGINIMKATKDPNQRCDRLQNLIREFTRLQNAYNWSRRVELSFVKHNSTLEPEAEPTPPDPQRSLPRTPPPRSAGCQPAVSPTASRPELDSSLSAEKSPQITSGFEPKRQSAGALPDASRNSEASPARAIVPDCGSPLPLSEARDTNSSTPQLLNSMARRSEAQAAQTPPSCQPIPPLAPTTPTPNSYLRTTNPPVPPRPYKPHANPIRGRRFVCIEG